MKSHMFKVVIEPDQYEDGRQAFHAYCPVLPGCHTSGFTVEEALKNIREAVELYVESLRAHGEPIPVDPDHGAVELPEPAVVVNF